MKPHPCDPPLLQWLVNEPGSVRRRPVNRSRRRNLVQRRAAG